jgi:hypothetical protein
MAHKDLKGPAYKMEVVLLVKDLESITQNISAYFDYCHNRQDVLADLLAKSSHN